MSEQKYLVLARKWRPQCFEDVTGQEHISRTLQNAIISGRIAHAFLFIGSRGIGKTTTARILAKALNCLSADGPTPTPCCTCENCTSIADGNNIDVIEIDAASNNGVDDVREIRDHVRLVPTRARYKIYIIDEVHQLSISAFNALLKTLEEPPSHAIFILATTEAHKIPATIISRCQRYDFRRVAVEPITKLLRKILDAEGVQCPDEALMAIARASEGGIRDSESILDQLLSYCDGAITYKDVYDVLGLVDWSVMHDLCDGLLNKDVGVQLDIIESIVSRGKDISQFAGELLRYFRNLLICKAADAKRILALPDNELAEMKLRADRFALRELITIVEQFAALVNGFESQLAQRIALETLLIRMSRLSIEVSLDSVLEKLMHLGEGVTIERSVLRSATAPAPAPRASTVVEPVDVPAAEFEPAMPAPLAPAPGPVAAPVDKRITATSENLAAAWNNLKTRIQHESLVLGVWITNFRAVGVDEGVLQLECDADNAPARDILEKPANRSLMETSLATHTTNLTTFTCTVLEPVAVVSKSQREGGGEPGKGGDRQQIVQVRAEDVREAMKDPHIAKVVDVFKGRIVEIRHDSKPRKS